MDSGLKSIELIEYPIGDKLLMTGTNLKSHEEFKVRLEKAHSQKIYTIKPFMACISRSENLIATEWYKEEGYSLWERLHGYE